MSRKFSESSRRFYEPYNSLKKSSRLRGKHLRCLVFYFAFLEIDRYCTFGLSSHSALWVLGFKMFNNTKSYLLKFIFPKYHLSIFNLECEGMLLDYFMYVPVMNSATKGFHESNLCISLFMQ